MKSYKQNKAAKSSIQVSKTVEGESIEKKVRRIVNNKEPILDSSPLIYTEGHEVNPDHNIRTDKWEEMVAPMTKVAERQKKRRKPAPEAKEVKEGMNKESGQTTSNKTTDNK